MNPDSPLPRPEHPQPQWERDAWLNLNGEWTFSFDFGDSGLERGFAASRGLQGSIQVPFCPESRLSCVEHRDFIPRMWYQRLLTVPAEWVGKRLFLRFGAVDYSCEAFLDGIPVGSHVGGSSSFAFDITSVARPGDIQSLVVAVRNDPRGGLQASGKQSTKFHSSGCHYTRVTGIWQTAWLEAVSEGGLDSMHVLPDFEGGAFTCIPRFLAAQEESRLRVTVSDADGAVVSRMLAPARNGVALRLPLSVIRSWGPAHPHLYGLLFEVLDAQDSVLDAVRSYAGLRTVHVQGDHLFLNGEPVFLRFVLDQGYYPEGIWTAPNDAALEKDILLAKQAGFNGARLHQKVFEPRYHYHADRLGFLTWGESANWGMAYTDPISGRNFLSEWSEILVRDRNHPSIIAWSPFNETAVRQGRSEHDRLQRDVYEISKVLDPTRPVNGACGWYQVLSDFFTAHNYQQDPAQLVKDLEESVFVNFPDKQMPYGGQPYFLSEFGGTWWNPDTTAPESRDASWGYGNRPHSPEEFLKRLQGLLEAVMRTHYVRGFCYTQLTDVEQEQNGLYTYDRKEKFPMKRIASIFGGVKPLPEIKD